MSADRLTEYFYAYAALRYLYNGIMQVREKELSAFGVTATQAGILFLVHTLGERATPAEIARVTLRKPHTISHILGKLQRMGLVEKHKDLKRANHVRVALTEKGFDVYSSVEARQSLRQIFSALDETELGQISLIAEKLLRRINESYGLNLKSLDELNLAQQRWFREKS